jgi:hypothetical protein
MTPVQPLRVQRFELIAKTNPPNLDIQVPKCFLEVDLVDLRGISPTTFTTKRSITKVARTRTRTRRTRRTTKN